VLQAEHLARTISQHLFSGDEMHGDDDTTSVDSLLDNRAADVRSPLRGIVLLVRMVPEAAVEQC
jgi:hypothetical protein